MYSDDDAGFFPTRCGRLQAMPLVRLCYSGKYTEREMAKYIRGGSGLVALLGTMDLREAERMADGGDARAALVLDALAYGIAKASGDLATAVCGKVDAIILTGGAAYSERLTSAIQRRIQWIAPVAVLPGEHEMEALAEGALRVQRGEEAARPFIWAQ